MPNWIYNTITFIGSDSEIAQIKDYVKSETSDFDFNKIIPMPEELNVEDGSLGWWGMDYLLYSKSSFPPKEAKLSIERFEKLDDAKKEKALDLGRKYLENIIKFGYRTWYDWRYDHWGTKWDAMDIEVNGNEYYFTTPGGLPFEILVHISKSFPGVEIKYHYYDSTNISSGDGAIRGGEELWYEYHDGYPVDDDGEYDESYQEQSASEAETTYDQSTTQEQMDKDLPF